jgi:hypothetical protein
MRLDYTPVNLISFMPFPATIFLRNPQMTLNFTRVGKINLVNKGTTSFTPLSKAGFCADFHKTRKRITNFLHHLKRINEKFRKYGQNFMTPPPPLRSIGLNVPPCTTLNTCPTGLCDDPLYQISSRSVKQFILLLT